MKAPNQTETPVIRNGMRIALLRAKGFLFGTRANQVISTCNSFLNLQVKMTQSTNAKFTISERNSILELPAIAAITDQLSTSVLNRFQVRTMYGDYFTASPWAGTAFDDGESTHILIAKPPHLRNSVASEVLTGGVHVDYTYDSDFVTRTAHQTDASPTFDDETHVVQCAYDDKDIWCIKTQDSGVKGKYDPDDGDEEEQTITWIDLNIDARAWCATPIYPAP